MSNIILINDINITINIDMDTIITNNITDMYILRLFILFLQKIEFIQFLLTHITTSYDSFKF